MDVEAVLDDGGHFDLKSVVVDWLLAGDVHLEHGRIGAALPADGGDCESVLAQFASAGIDVNALATRLQTEGAQAFTKSWNELMEVIASKAEALRMAA